MVTTRSKSPGSSVGGDSAKKKTRRRRGKRTHRKDGSTGSPAASDIDLSADGEDLMQAKRRRRTNSLGAPPAPRNTTQFLLEDIATRDHEAAETEKRRTRSASTSELADADADESSSSSEMTGGAEGSSAGLSTEEERERLMEEEFEVDYREAAYDTYASMDKDTLAARLVAVEKSRDEVRSDLQKEKARSARLAEEKIQAEEVAAAAVAKLKGPLVESNLQ